MGGITDREGCGSVLQYDRTGSGGYEIVSGKSGTDGISSNEQVQGGEQRTDTESIDRGTDAGGSDETDGQEAVVTTGQKCVLGSEGGAYYWRIY